MFEVLNYTNLILNIIIIIIFGNRKREREREMETQSSGSRFYLTTFFLVLLIVTAFSWDYMKHSDASSSVNSLSSSITEILKRDFSFLSGSSGIPETSIQREIIKKSEDGNEKGKEGGGDKKEKGGEEEEEVGGYQDAPLTNTQIVLFILYTCIMVWVLFWETIFLIRKFFGLTPLFQSLNGVTVDSASHEAPPQPVEQGANTFLPNFSLWKYDEATQRVGRGAALFGTIILLFYLVDGPRAWHGPDNRSYDRDLFIFICACITVMGFLTMRDTHKKINSILNREQTEEWKGYMQIGFVLYHYFAAKETYNMIRIFIAAYVWMTGFGNFSYFWTRKDYSFVRMAKMLIRLNWLVFFICAIMDKRYMLYYVCPLHTFYFIVVYATMAIFPEKNYEPFWMRIKFGICFLFLFFLFEIPGVFEVFWSPLSFVLSYEGSLHEWYFRAGLDRYCALLGMIYAYNYPTVEAWLKKVEAYTQKNEYITKSIVVATATVVGFFWTYYILTMNKYDYNKIHPYTSFLPMTVYIIYRNISLKSRGWV